jgi:hypothetical protein
MTQQRPWISSRDGSAPNVERGLRRERLHPVSPFTVSHRYRDPVQRYLT